LAYGSPDLESRRFSLLNKLRRPSKVSFGSITDIELRESDVRLTPESGPCGMRTRDLAEKRGGLR
jgi:hypothetical protein